MCCGLLCSKHFSFRLWDSPDSTPSGLTQGQSPKTQFNLYSTDSFNSWINLNLVLINFRPVDPHHHHRQGDGVRRTRDIMASSNSTTSNSSYMDQSQCFDSTADIGRDSGFLSGSCPTESEIDVGSGSTSYQRADSGVDVDLSMSGMSLSDNTKTMSITPHPKEIDLNEYHDWQSYFRACDEDGDTQLHIGIVEGLVEGVFTLISLAPHQSILDFQNDAAQTPLHLAVLTRQPRVVRRLVAAGARVDMRDRFGNTPLHLAAASGDLGSVQALTTSISEHESIQCGLRYPPYAQPLPRQLDLLNYEGQGPVHLAAINGHSEVVRTLHWLGADMNLQDGKGGRTALHFAVERGHSSIVRTLVTDCGASLESTTYGGLTPYQIATECQATYLAEELRSLGASIPTVQPEDEDMDSESSDSSDSESDVP